MRIKHIRRQAGDTIVEVLIAIAVVSLVLAGAYASSNHDVSAQQDSQEHGQALKLAQTQVEFLRDNSAAISGFNCFNPNSTPTPGAPARIAAPNSPCIVLSNGQPANGPAQQPQYTLKISPPDPTTHTYTIDVTWTSLLSSSSKADVQLYYRPQQ